LFKLSINLKYGDASAPTAPLRRRYARDDADGDEDANNDDFEDASDDEISSPERVQPQEDAEYE
jgi:hypothetical protein